MKASIVDLRYKMKNVINALKRNEQVEVMYHGKLLGVISPVEEKIEQKVEDHPYFGMNKNNKLSVEEEIEKLRKRRYDDF